MKARRVKLFIEVMILGLLLTLTSRTGVHSAGALEASNPVGTNRTGIVLDKPTGVVNRRQSAPSKGRARSVIAGMPRSKGFPEGAGTTGASGVDADSESVDFIGRIGGISHAVAVQGDHAYAGIGPGLTILDVSERSKPVRVGYTTMADIVASVAVSEGHAYVVTNEGLHVVDVSNPAAPIQVGSHRTPAYTQDAAVSGSYAYVVDGYGLYIIDVSDPTAPTEVGHYDGPRSAKGVAIADGRAYVVDGGGDLSVLDVSEPAAPSQVGEYKDSGSAYDIAVNGDYAYIANLYYGLRIIDISDPTAPARIGHYGPGVDRVAVAGDLVYFSDTGEGFHIIDVSDPAAPYEVGQYDFPYDAETIVISDGSAFVADREGGLRILDVSDPTALTEAGHYDTGGNVRGVAISGIHAFVADGNGGLRVIDVSQPVRPRQVAHHNEPGYLSNVAVSGSYAYVTHLDDGLGIVDISDRTNPAKVAYCDTPGSPRDVVVVGDYAFVADHGGGLRVIDISTPSTPKELGFHDPPGGAVGVAVSGDYAYVAWQNDGLRINDISNPAAPTEVAHYESLGDASGLAVSGDYVFAATEDGLTIIDISDPMNPSESGSYDAPGLIDVAVSEDRAFVVNGVSLRVVDVSDPTAPTQVGQHYTPSTSVQVAASGDYAYVGCREAGLLILRYTGAAGPTPTLIASPTSLPADGASTANVTLSDAPAGHQVRFISSRRGLDVFKSLTGIVDGSGQFATTITSSAPGTAVITAKDLTTGQTFATSASVTFTSVDDEPEPPPPNEGAVGISGVDTTLPLSGRYPAVSTPFLQSVFGDIFQNQIDVAVDWHGTTPGRVDFILNGIPYSVTADAQGASYELDMGAELVEGQNEIQIIAYNAAGEPSETVTYAPVMWTMPDWLVNLLQESQQASQAQMSVADGDDPLPFEVTSEISRNPWMLKIWFKIPKKELLSKIQLSPGDFRTPGLQFVARLQVPLEGTGDAELRGGPRYLNERERTRAAGHERRGLSILGTEFTGEAYAFGRWEFDLYVLQSSEVGGGTEIEVSKTWERTWLALLYLFGLPDPYPFLLEIPVVGQPAAKFIARIASGYFTLSGRAEAEFAYQLEPVRQFDSFDFLVGAGSEIGLQADVRVVEVTGKYGADADATLLCLRNAVESEIEDNVFCDLTFEGQGEMKVRAFGWKVPLLEFGHFKKVWPDEGQATGYARGSKSGLASKGSGGWQLIPHSGRENRVIFEDSSLSRQAFAPTSELRRLGSVEAQATMTSMLVSNVYTYSEPALAVDSVSGDGLMLWVHDDVSKPVGQSHEIQFSHWDGSTWSAPVDVTDDSQLDSGPQVSWTGKEEAIAVWQRVNDTLPVTATFHVTTAKKIEIATAVYSPTADTWSPVALLTGNDALDFKPQLARSEAGDLLAVWRQNPAGLLSGDEAEPDRIMATFYDDGWDTPSVAVDGIPGLMDLAVGYGDGAATIAYTRFLTPTGSVTLTLQLFTSAWDGTAWSPPQQLTDDNLGHTNPQVVYNDLNQPLLVWQAGDALRLRNLSAGTVVSLTLPAEIGYVDEFEVVQDQVGNIGAVFTAQDGQRDLYVALYDRAHDLWGNPLPLTDDRASEKYPTPALDSEGRLLMGYAATAMHSVTHTTTISDTGQVVTYTVPSEGQTDLLTLSHVFTRNLTLDDDALILSNDHPAPGDTVVLSATVRNSGDLALEAVSIAFYDGDPQASGSLIGSDDLDAPLAAGFSTTVSVSYTVPVTGGGRTLYAVADPADVISESNEEDNTASLAAFGPDLAIVGAAAEPWSGSEVGLRALIENLGTTASPTATLTYHWDAVTGTRAVTDTVPPMGAGEALTLTTPWDYGALAEGTYALAAVVNQSQQDFTEVFTDDNDASLTLEVLPDLAVSPLYLWTEPLPDGRVLITGTVYNFGSVAAPPAELAFYVDDPLTETARITATTLPGLDPAGHLPVTTTWDAPTFGEHDFYLSVNGDRAVTETTHANNLASTSDASVCTALEVDFDCSCLVDVADVMAVAGNWRCQVGEACYRVIHDRDDDGEITVVDIMRVASRWGDACGGGSAAHSVHDPAEVTARTDSAVVSVEPLTSTLDAGEAFTVSVTVTDVVNLGAFQFAMGYDPAVVHVEGVTLGPFLGSSGRNASPLGPTIQNEEGLMIFGAFSFGSRSGPDGGGVLAEVGLTSRGAGETDLDLRDLRVLSPAGEPNPATATDGAVLVKRKLYLPLVLRPDR